MNSAFWWYPAGTVAPAKIDLGRKLSDLQIMEGREIYDAVSAGGGLFRVDFGGSRQVRIILERIPASTGAALVRSLRSLETHLLAGGRVSFALDDGKAWGSWAVSTPAAGATAIMTSGNEFTVLGTSTLGSSDVVSIESPNPECLREFRALSSVGVLGLVTLSEAVLQSYSVGPVFVREQDFYPVLVLPESSKGKPILTHDRRLNWTLDVTLLELPAEIEALQTNARLLGKAGAWRDSGAVSLTDAVRRSRAGGRF